VNEAELYELLPRIWDSQIFRNGIIEAVDMRAMNYTSQDYPHIHIYDWRKTEGWIYKAILRYADFLTVLQVPKPWYIYISLLNAKGFLTQSFNYGSSKRIDKDIVHATEGVWEEDSQTLAQVIRPAFDSLSNCFGWSHSTNFNENGDYIIRSV
jgi:hypothetical protein